MQEVTKILILIMSIISVFGVIAYYNFKYFIKFCKWFLSTFNKDYTPAGEFKPDFKKIIAFILTKIVGVIALVETIRKGYNNELFWGLLLTIGAMVGANIAPLFNKNSSQVKMAEFESTKTTDINNPSDGTVNATEAK